MEQPKSRLWDSLRVRVALGVALPIFLILGIFTVIHTIREFNLLADQARINALQLGDILIHRRRAKITSHFETAELIGVWFDSVVPGRQEIVWMKI